jgi:uncharacterized protein YdeI (YjbR/CyaY-like superfamily)
LVIPDELKSAFVDDQELKVAYEDLTLFKQREYAGYIESAKRLETKMSRLYKIIPMINQGIGLNDKYR